MMQKKIAAGLAVLLAAGTILGGCGESGAAGNDSVSDAAGNEAAALTEAKTTPYGRYPETITYTLAKMTGVNNSNLPEGETYEDNAYTRLIREIINVQNEDVYENYGDTYNVGISTMIATGNIADIMVVDQKTMNAMQKNDQLADLTEVYANCASERIKDMLSAEQYSDFMLMLRDNEFIFTNTSVVYGLEFFYDKSRTYREMTLEELTGKSFI